MPYQWKDILQEWLLGQVVEYNPKEIVDAFNDVERIMGSKWLDRIYGQTRGTAAAIQVIDLGKTLKEVEKIPNGSKLIANIRKNFSYTIIQGDIGQKCDPLMFLQFSDYLHELGHAIEVARLTAHYRKHYLKVELEPELVVKGHIRHPDMRVKFSEVWIYVEVACPAWSAHAQQIHRIMHRITKVRDEIETYCHIEVYLYKDPTEEEVAKIIETCKILAQKQQDFRPQEYSFRGVAQIFVSPWEQECLSTFHNKVEEKSPILGLVSFEIKREGNFTYGKKCTVNMPFTDYRAQRILNDKIKQLSKEEPGLIVMGLSGVPGGLKHWPELIRRRLQPNLNRRIGAVLLTENAITSRSMKSEKVLIEHPNPIHALPREFINTTVSPK